jgi:hypothetical protein
MELRKTVVLLLFVFAPASLAAQAAQPEVRRVPLSPAPFWTVSAVSGPDGELLVADSVSREIYRYDGISGQRLGAVSGLAGAALPKYRPSEIELAPGGYAVEVDTAYLVFLDESLRPSGELNVLAGSQGARGQVASLYSWSVVGGDLIAFGDVNLSPSTKGGEWVTALVRIPRSDPSSFQLLHRIDLRDPARDYALVGLDLMATIGGDAYFLLLDSPPKIFKVGPGALSPPTLRPEDAHLLAGFQVGKLPQTQGFLKEDVIAIFGALEAAAIPAGLYGWEGRLWLLTRRPLAGSAGTHWELTGIDPSGRSASIVREVPTTVPHIVAVPGPGSWRFIEKLTVTGFGKQEVTSVLEVPGSYFRPSP